MNSVIGMLRQKIEVATKWKISYRIYILKCLSDPFMIAKEMWKDERLLKEYLIVFLVLLQPVNDLWLENWSLIFKFWFM